MWDVYCVLVFVCLGGGYVYWVGVLCFVFVWFVLVECDLYVVVFVYCDFFVGIVVVYYCGL